MSAYLPTIGIWSIHTALSAGLVLVLTRFLMRRIPQPATQQRTGEFGLCAALLTGVLICFPAWLILPWDLSGVLSPPDADNGGRAAAEVEVATPLVPPAPLQWEPAPPDWPVVPIPPVAVAPEPPPIKAPPKESPIENDSDKQEERTSSVWFSPSNVRVALSVLGGVYLTAVALFILRLLVGFLALMRLTFTAHRARESYERMLEIIPDCHGVRLLESNRLKVPISFGFLRPTIVLPTNVRLFADPAKLRWILAHELTHIRRRDAWSSLLCAITKTVFWYLPWCWTICRQIRLCQEFVADDAIGGKHQADYAEFLLNLTKSPAVPVLATGVSGNVSELYRRVSMLVDKPKQAQRGFARGWFFAAATSLVALGVVMSGIGLAGGKRRTVIIIDEVQGKDGAKTQKKVRVFVAPNGGQGKIAFPRGFKEVKTGDGKKVIIIKKIVGDAKLPKALKLIVPKIVGSTDVNKDVKIIVVGPKGKEKKQSVRVKVVGGDGKNKNVEEIELELDIQGDLKKVNLEKVLEQLKKHLDAKTYQRIRDSIRGAKGKKGAKKSDTKIEKRIRVRVADPFGKQGKAPQYPKDYNEAIQRAIKEYQKSGKDVDLSKVLPKYDGATYSYQAQIFDPRGKAYQVDPRTGRVYQFSPYYAYPYQRARLGVEVYPPSPILAAHLELPKGKGMVVTRVIKNSVADKAGFKNNDVLVEIGGAKISSNYGEFVRQVGKLEGGKKVTAVVYRKGKRKSIKGIAFPKRKKVTKNRVPGGVYGFGPGRNSVMISVTRNGDQFTGRYLQGALNITVRGSVAKGKAAAKSIEVRAGGKRNTYKSINDVPETHRAKAQQILDTIERSTVKDDTTK